MAYCYVCQENKPVFTVLHLPHEDQLPQNISQTCCVHSTCSDCVQQLMLHGQLCPSCRTPLNIQEGGDRIVAPENTCVQIMIERTRNHGLQPRFCRGRAGGSPYCAHHGSPSSDLHANGSPESADPLIVEFVRNRILHKEVRSQLKSCEAESNAYKVVRDSLPVDIRKTERILERVRASETDESFKKKRELMIQNAFLKVNPVNTSLSSILNDSSSDEDM